MSGGSYEYLCFKEVDELFGADRMLQEMADDLAHLGYAADVAGLSQDLVLEMRAARNRIDAYLSKLQPVWRAMEWWQSGDTSEDGFKRALQEFRSEVA